MSSSDEHEKALKDLARHTGDSTSDRLERLKRIEQLRLKGYQKVQSLTEVNSGTSPSQTRATRRSYTSFSQEKSPSFYGSLGRINHVGGVKPKSYSSQSVLDPAELSTNSQKTRSSSVSDDEGEDRPKHLLRSKSATIVSDTGLSAFEFGSEQNNPMGSEEEHWRERNDSYNEEDENIEDFKKSLFGDSSSYANKTSPRTDGALKAFSLSREWSSGGADYENQSEEQGNQIEATENDGESFSMFPSYNSEFLGMNYGETFDSPRNYGTTIRKSFSRERSRQPLLRSFSSQRETAPVQSHSFDYSTGNDLNTSRLDSSGSYRNTSRLDSTGSYRNTSRLDSALDKIFTPSGITEQVGSHSYERQNRYLPGTDPSYSVQDTSYTRRGLSSGDWTARNNSSVSSERKKIGISSETESKLDQLFGTPAESVLSNRPSFTSTSRRTETPGIKNRSDRITITRIRSNNSDGRKLSESSTFDQTRDRIPDLLSTRVFGSENYDPRQSEDSAQSSLDTKLDSIFQVPDVLSTRMMDNDNYNTSRVDISRDRSLRENPVPSQLDQKLDSIFSGPDVLSTRMMDNENYNSPSVDISRDRSMRENPVPSQLDQKLDNIFSVPNVLSTRMMDNENYELIQSKRQGQNNKAKPTITSMLYGTDNETVTPGEITQREGRLREVRRPVTEIKRRRHQNPDQDQEAFQQSHTNGEELSDGAEIIQEHLPKNSITSEGSTDTVNGMSVGDVDMNENDDMVTMDNSEFHTKTNVSETVTLAEAPMECYSEENLTQQEEIGKEENGIHGDNVVTECSNEEEITRLISDLSEESMPVDISQTPQQSAEPETIRAKGNTDTVERDEIQVTKEQQSQKETKGKQADSKKNKKKSKGKKSKGKKGQKNVEKLTEKEKTNDSSKQVLETDIDAPLCQIDQQSVGVIDCVDSSSQEKPSEGKNSASASNIQNGDEGENSLLKDTEVTSQTKKENEEGNIPAENEEEEGNIEAENMGEEGNIHVEGNIQTENEEEENYVEAEEERCLQVENDGTQSYIEAMEEVLRDDAAIDEHTDSKTGKGNELKSETQQSEKSPTKNTSWFRSKFSSLLHGFGTDSNANETETEVQPKLENNETVSKLEVVSTVNGDMNMNVVTASDAGTASEDDYATASDDDITKTGDDFYETNYSQSVQNSNIRNDQISAEMSSEGDAVDIFSELAATTGMPLDMGEQFQDQDYADIEGHVMYEREEKLLRCDKEETLEKSVKSEDDRQDVKEQEMYMQSEARVFLHDEINKKEEMDFNYQGNSNKSRQLSMNKVNEMVSTSDMTFKMDVKQSVCLTEMAIQTDVEAYLTADKVSASVQTLPLKVDKWTQTDTELAVDSKESGIQTSPTTADYGAQYNVSVEESEQGIQASPTTADYSVQYNVSVEESEQGIQASPTTADYSAQYNVNVEESEQGIQVSPSTADYSVQYNVNVEESEQGIQASPTTADYSAQYNVNVSESGVQVIDKSETKQVKDDQFQSMDLELKNENVSAHVNQEHQSSEQTSSEQVPQDHLSSKQVKLAHSSSEQIQSKELSSKQVKLEHPSYEQVESKPVKHEIAAEVNSALIVTDKITAEYAVAEQINIEHVDPGQVKVGSAQTSGTAQGIPVTEELAKVDTVNNEYSTQSSNHTKEDSLENVDHSTAVRAETPTSDGVDDIKVIRSVEGQVTASETINTWSHTVAAPTEISFSSQSLGKKVPPQPLPKRRSKHGSSKPSSRPSSIVAEGDGFDFHRSEQSTAKLESSSFNFNKILKPETINTEIPLDNGKELDNTKTVGTAKAEVPGPLSPGAKESGRVPTGSSSTVLTMMGGPKSPRAQEHGMDAKECSSATGLSNTGVTSPQSSFSGKDGLGSHSNKGNLKSPPPALLPKRKATSQLQMPTSPKSPTSPRSPDKLELLQEYDPVFAKQMKMNNGEQKIVKEPINRLKDNPFIRKDGNVKVGRQESFSRKCEVLTTSKPRTLSSSLTPKSPKDEPKGTGEKPTPVKEPAVDLNVLDSKSLRSEIIRQSTSRSSMRNVAKSTKKVDNIRSKMETSSDSSVSESSSIVNKIISDAAKFEAKFSSGSSGNDKDGVISEVGSALGHVSLERENPFIKPVEDTSVSLSTKASSDSPSIEEKSTYMETSFDGKEEQSSKVIQKETQGNVGRNSTTNHTYITGDEEKDLTRIKREEKLTQELENKMEPPQRKRKLKVQVPPPIKLGEGQQSEDVPGSPSLALLVSSELQEIGMEEIAGLATKPANLQNSPTTNGAKVNAKNGQQNAAKPPSPKTGKPPSPKIGKPPSPKTRKTPSPKIGKPPSPTASKTPPPRHNRPLSPKVGKTPPSPQNRKSPSPKLTTTSPSNGGKQKTLSGSTPPSPRGQPLSPRVRQSPLSKAMFGDKENGKPGSDATGDSRSRRRSSEKTGSISSRTSSVSSEGSFSLDKVDARYEMHISEEEKRGVAIDEDEDDDQVLPSRINIRDWNPTKLLTELYTVKLAKEEVEDVSDKFVGMEGLMEKLPMNKKKATLLKTWKRRFFRAKDGWLHYFETNNRDRPSDSVQLMGGRIDDLGNRILGIDDGRGRYLMVRCPTDKEYGQWKLALESQTIDNVGATYVRPVLKSPPNQRRKVVLIDIGSCSIRAGILGQEATVPEVFFPSMVARNKDSGEIHIGTKAYHPDIRKTSALMKAVRPTSKMDKDHMKAFNVDTEVMPAVLQKIFTDLNVDPTKYWIMMSTPQNLADQLKAALFEILIGQFRVKGVCMVMQSLLALYSYQKTSGILVDIGQRMEILPICDGYVIEGGVSRQSYGGQKVEDSLNSSLTENKYVFGAPVEQLILRHIMEQSCYVAEDYDELEKKCASDPESCQSTVFLDNYDLPEGAHRMVTHDRSCYHSPEGFFNTDLWGMDYPCVHNLVFKAIQFCPIDSRKQMYRAIYLSGGVTMMPGFAERLQKELIKLAPPSVIVEVHASPQRYHAAYIGACSLANMDMFEQSCITGDEWARNGVKAFAKWAMQSS